MCYNSECRIEIKSRIDGTESAVSAEGKVTKTSEALRFDYGLDGDRCTLTVNANEVIQSRRGEQNIEMTFRKGEQTECFLKSGGFSGTFQVFTHDLQCMDGKSGFTLSIVYTLGGQKTELNFSAEYKIREKQ